MIKFFIYEMHIICAAVNIIWLHSYGTYIFQLNTFPQWAITANQGLWSPYWETTKSQLKIQNVYLNH